MLIDDLSIGSIVIWSGDDGYLFDVGIIVRVDKNPDTISVYWNGQENLEKKPGYYYVCTYLLTR